MVTHDKEEALMMSDKIAVMINGEIAQLDTPKNLYEKPISKEDINIHNFNYIEGLEAKVLKKVYAGDITYYDVSINDTLIKISSNNSLYEVGEDVKITINPKNVVYFKK